MEVKSSLSSKQTSLPRTARGNEAQYPRAGASLRLTGLREELWALSVYTKP